jgi:hypothetical protein
VADSIERLSFELTTRALAEQERAVSALRTCAGTVLGVASVAGSFLGAHVGGRPLDGWSVTATLAFALCSGSAIWVLMPREIVLSIGGEELMADADRRNSSQVAEGYRAVCSWLGPQLELNRRRIDRLGDWMTLSCALLAIEVILWTISITG